MDYLEMAALTRHVDFDRFEEWRLGEGRRLLLFSTRAALPCTDFAYADGDVLLFGRESAGVPDHVQDRADARLLIPRRRAAGAASTSRFPPPWPPARAMRQLG